MAATASPVAAAGLSRVQVTGLINLMLVSGVSNSMLNKCVFCSAIRCWDAEM
jgi:hypothetical protein